MQEQWEILKETPNYVISSFGNFESRKNGRPIIPSINQQGIAKITLYQDRQYITKSVALLVAETFLPKPNYKLDTPTPINLDGDRTNCSVDNLMWRPRWFAIKYHQERKHELFPDWRRSFEDVDTGEVFKHPRDCATKYGLLEKDIYFSVMNEEPVYGTTFSFRFI